MSDARDKLKTCMTRAAETHREPSLLHLVLLSLLSHMWVCANVFALENVKSDGKVHCDQNLLSFRLGFL